MKIYTATILVALCGAALSTGAAKLPTAKEAVALANAKLDAAAQNQVLLLEGTQSDTDLRFRQWDITFYDTNRVNNGTIIRIKDGAVVSAASAIRLFDDARWSRFGRNMSGFDPAEIVSPPRWVLDSNQAISNVLARTELAGLQVTEVKVSLRKPSDGDVPPVWRVQLRARAHDQPHRERWIGFIKLNAENGEVLVNELRVEQLKR